jgi:glycosyltransferase involved in cell wall biosynthesis
VHQLPGIYADCDICLVLSSTNLSLLPLEIMASGSVVACSEGANNEWLLSEEDTILVGRDPREIAATLAEYLNSEDLLAQKRAAGLALAESTSWEHEGDLVRDILMAGIEEDFNTLK